MCRTAGQDKGGAGLVSVRYLCRHAHTQPFQKLQVHEDNAIDSESNTVFIRETHITDSLFFKPVKIQRNIQIGQKVKQYLCLYNIKLWTNSAVLKATSGGGGGAVRRLRTVQRPVKKR